MAGCMAAAVALSACSSGAALSSGGSGDLTLGWVSVEPVAVTLPETQPFVGSADDLAAGEPVLINFWASTCAPCKRELPILEKANQESGVEVVGVTRDQFERYAQSAIDRASVTYPNWMDEDASYSEQFSDLLPVNALPTSALVVDNRVIAVHVGPFETVSELTSQVSKMTASTGSN